MNTHEFQAKEILQRYHIPVPPFGVASNGKEARAVVERLHLSEAVVKIQVHAGGRGKAGGVRLVRGGAAEIVKVAEELIGMKMVNQQTGPDGVVAHKVLISEASEIDSEFYMGIIMDRSRAAPIMIASPEGGMEIEEVALHYPDKILTLELEPGGKMRGYKLLRLVKFMGWKGEIARRGMKIAEGLAKAFWDFDASLLEINPLVLTPDQRLVALDAKLSVDDNALFRQEEINSFYDPTQQSEREVMARQFDLAYIALDGNIGCMVNGAGLAMATMDLIQSVGGRPANFLDVGGSASKEKVAEGFKIILSDPNVKAILVNIFGGIMNCGTLAEGIVAAANEVKIQVPLVVRMEGTNVSQGKEILKKSGLAILTADSLAEAAEKAHAALHGRGR